MTYEICNPSDAYTMKSDNEPAACVACLLLGEGAYPLENEAGKIVMPAFIFGGDPDATLKASHGRTVDDVMENDREAVAAALDSVLIGSKRDRQNVESAVSRMSESDAKSYLAEYHDRRRSSMNNIGKRATALAKALRKDRAAEGVTP